MRILTFNQHWNGFDKKFSDFFLYRVNMAIHPGDTTSGSVTVTDDNCWVKTKDVLDMGVMSYAGTDRGFLYVL